jgi:hypothetical protein
MTINKPFWIAAVVAILGGLAAFVVFVVLPWLNPEDKETILPDVGPARARDKVPVPHVYFKDVTDKAGIRFVHNNGSTGHKLLPETMGSGVAFLDYNNDGHQDILFINSCDWPGAARRQGCSRTLELYENDGHGHFTDVTHKVGLDVVVMFGMGVTVGDFDNDGHPDLFITGVGGNRLFRNVLVGKDDQGKEVHRFEEVTEKAGLLIEATQRWPAGAGSGFLKRKEPISFASSAAFVDYDGDGWLDLFVCNYVTWSPAADLGQGFDRTGQGKRNFGPPTNFAGTYCVLYRNLGRDAAGKWLGFKDVSKAAGIQVDSTLGRPAGKALGVAVCDVDGDGFPDIIVANDTARNFFFHNKGDGTFEEIGEQANVAYAEGSPRGAMGIDSGWYQPGRLGVLIGNFANEPNTFLRLEVPERMIFSDTANSEGIAGPSRQWLKFGALFVDYDLDGRLDLLTCNGQLEPEIKQLDESQDYRQPVQLFWNTGRKDSSFEPVTAAEAGADLFRPLVGRGCAYGDIDGDGYPDLVLIDNGGAARLLHNEGGTGNHCLRLVLKGDGRRSNTSAIGARVVLTAGKAVLTRDVVSARGYLSQSELPITFGLGKATRVDRVVIRWPGKQGGTQELKGLRADHVYVVEQGKKDPVARPLRKR